ncbi:SRPBCC domain-containing protein [Actinoplanes sp. NPDC049681]|uniref:SRPBCC domain-containing protein n=1 Tax=Actinoplanes sp. NPDC049681 TaxID=3363905 RepID=UPI00378B1861
MKALPPIRRQVAVPAAADVAFRVFVERIGAWWPLARFSVHGEKATVEFRDGRLIETGPDGEVAEWGTVLQWRPPHELRMTWHPGRGADRAGEVAVLFVPVTAAQTLVTIEHSGWENYPDPVAGRQEYRNGWPAVVGAFAEQIPGNADGGEPVWLVLHHTAAPGVDDVFADPRFAGHPAFLARLREREILVAAGPFPLSGEGMTILRLSDASQVPDVVRAANEDDRSVATGLLEVHVRPWTPMITGMTLS